MCKLNNIGKYAVLRYVPDIERQEFINLGVVLHDLDNELLKMQAPEDLSRLRVFNNELDLSFLEFSLEKIKMEFDSESEKGPSKKIFTESQFFG